MQYKGGKMASCITHMLVAFGAKKVIREKEFYELSEADIRYLAGSVMPDFEHLARAKDIEQLKDEKERAKLRGKHLSRFDMLRHFKNANKNVYEGIKAHFFLDDYSHPNYIYRKIDLFRQKNFNPFATHMLVELSLDKFVLRQHPDFKNVHAAVGKHLLENATEYSGHFAKIMNKDQEMLAEVIKDAVNITNLKHYSFPFGLLKYKKAAEKYYPKSRFFLSKKQAVKSFLNVYLNVESDYKSFLRNSLDSIRQKINAPKLGAVA